MKKKLTLVVTVAAFYSVSQPLSTASQVCIVLSTASHVCIVVTVAAFCQARDKQAFSRLGRVFRVSGLNARVVGWGLSRLLNLIPSQCGQARSKQTMVHDDTPGFRCKATWKREFKLPWREAGPPNHHHDRVDSDQ